MSVLSKPEVLTIDSVVEVLSLKGVYILGYGWLMGMSIWVTFIGGVIAFKTLPRQQFGALQHRTFPWYFNISILLSSGLLLLWTKAHPHVIANLANPRLADVAQAYALGTVIASQLANQTVIGPMTSKTMFQRHKLEKQEGKSYNEPGVSAEMRALNSKFSRLHGISSLLNLAANISLIFHGLWVGTKGLGNL